jgi:hypothetical protein
LSQVILVSGSGSSCSQGFFCVDAVADAVAHVHLQLEFAGAIGQLLRGRSGGGHITGEGPLAGWFA